MTLVGNQKNNTKFQLVVTLVLSLVTTGVYYSWQVVSTSDSTPTIIDLTLSASPYDLSTKPTIPHPLNVNTPDNSQRYSGEPADSSIAVSKLPISNNASDIQISTRLPQQDLKYFDKMQNRQQPPNVGKTLVYKPSALEINKELRQLFDAHLKDWRNKVPSEMKKEISDHLSQHYKEHEQQRAQDIFAIYLSYIRQLDNIPSENKSIESMVTFFNQMVLLRKQVLGKHLADAFFSEDERYDRAILARQHILHNKKLSEVEKNLLINRLENVLFDTTINLSLIHI